MEHKTTQEITDAANAMSPTDKAAKVRIWENMSTDEKKKIYSMLCLRKLISDMTALKDFMTYNACFCAGDTDMPVTANLWENAGGDFYLDDVEDLPEGESMMTLVYKDGDTFLSMISEAKTLLDDTKTVVDKFTDAGEDVDGDGYKVIEEVLL